MDDDAHSAGPAGPPVVVAAPARPRLRPPFDTWSAEVLLEHFATRTDVHFFAVADELESRPDTIETVLDHRFELNEETHRLHAFSYAVGLGIAYRDTGDRRHLDRWIALTDSWIRAARTGSIAADVTARRVQNWISAYHLFVAEGDARAIPPDFHLRFLASLDEQVSFLSGHLTPDRHRRALELGAVFLAGVVFPELAAAAAWRAIALPELVHDLKAELLPDGVHGSLSTDRHHRVLKHYLGVRRLAAANSIAVPAEMDATLIRALEFSMHVHNPAGIVPSFSDGDVRGHLDLLRQGHELFGRDDMLFVATRGLTGTPPAARSAAFPEAGYYVVRSGWGADGRDYRDEQHLVLDCGPLGAGDHGHFDCLSVELYGLGRALVVDPGRYTDRESGETNWRARFRSTAAHNTVTVDYRSQTRYEPLPGRPGGDGSNGRTRYHVTGPAPEHRLIERICQDGFDLLHGSARSHEYDAVHERRIFFVDGRYWVIADSLVGHREHLYEARFHLGEWAQDRITLNESPSLLALVSPHLLIVAPRQEGLTLQLEPGHVSHRSGKKLPAPVACFGVRAARATLVALLLPCRQVPLLMPVIEEIRVSHVNGRAAPLARAFTISLGAEHDVLFFGGKPDQEYRFDSFVFTGRHVLVRRNAAGAVVRVHTHEGADLREGGSPVQLGTSPAPRRNAP
ncbi:MAG TPA: alginate lyase family protein [Methylomirabilota bacterium]|nr:alginate lyase family protein [Methylomirabilota bacterium]